MAMTTERGTGENEHSKALWAAMINNDHKQVKEE